MSSAGSCPLLAGLGHRAMYIKYEPLPFRKVDENNPESDIIYKGISGTELIQYNSKTYWILIQDYSDELSDVKCYDRKKVNHSDDVDEETHLDMNAEHNNDAISEFLKIQETDKDGIYRFTFSDFIDKIAHWYSKEDQILINATHVFDTDTEIAKALGCTLRAAIRRRDNLGNSIHRNVNEILPRLTPIHQKILITLMVRPLCFSDIQEWGYSTFRSMELSLMKDVNKAYKIYATYLPRKK